MTRPSPMSMNIERNLVGCICVDAPTALFNIEQHGLTEASFTDPAHRLAFTVARSLVNTGEITVDEHTLATALSARGMEDAEDYCEYVFSRGQNLDAIPAYCKLIKDAHVRRQIKQIAAQLESESDNHDLTVEQIKARAEDQLLSLATVRREVSWQDATATRAVMWREARLRVSQGCPGTIGVPFASEGLNRLLGGARKGRITLVAAPEKGGKTIWWGGECCSQAFNGVKVGAWCGEMTADEIAGRSAARDAQVSSFSLDTGYVSTQQLDLVEAMLTKIGKLPIIMSDDPMDIDELCSWIRRAMAKDGIEIMYVDHLDLIDGKGSDYERVSNNIKRLRDLALQTNLPIVVLHQFSNKYKHENRPPDERDLRDSGKVGHNAYSVNIFYQDVYGDNCDDSKIVWKVILNRGGPTGNCLFHRKFEVQEMVECSREERDAWRKLKGWKGSDTSGDDTVASS